MKNYDVITMGSGLVDAFVYTGVKEKNNMISFPIGTKISVSDITFSSGGGGTNTASSFSKLGLKVGFIGKIGSGYNGKIILRELKKYNIDFLGVSAKMHTGYSIVLETNNKNRTILTFKGASNKLKFSEIKLKNLKTNWFHFTSMGGDSFETQKRLIDYALKNNIKISFNPSSYQIKDSNLSNFIKNSHVLSMNDEEAKLLVGNLSNENLFKKIHKMGPKIVCITRGGNGGGVSDGEHYYSYRPHKAKVGECTGAGDAFSSSFVTGLIKFDDVEKAIKLAIVNSESVINEPGAKSGLLSLNEALKIMKTHKFNIKKVVL